MSQQFPQQYPQQGAPGQDVYGQQPPAEPSYDNYETNAPPGVPPGPPPGPAHAGRKKRAYAGQAYEFGAGGNAALGGQQQAGGAYPAYSAQAEAAGYPQGGYQQNPAAVQQSATPMYPGQEPAPAIGGYQAPAPGYPAAGAGGVPGMTQQFAQMDMSQKPPIAAAPQQSQRAPVLNQLYPTDLSNQPFNVVELDYPPPPAILPPNVCIIYASLSCPFLTT
jgi:protein transport protein SEC24